MRVDLDEKFEEYVFTPPKGVSVKQVGTMSQIFGTPEADDDIIYLRFSQPVSMRDLFKLTEEK